MKYSKNINFKELIRNFYIFSLVLFFSICAVYAKEKRIVKYCLYDRKKFIKTVKFLPLDISLENMSLKYSYYLKIHKAIRCPLHFPKSKENKENEENN